MAVFGADYVADSAVEVFYIREKPVVPQPGDGVIKVPAPGQMQFSDGFKVDVTGHGVSAQRTLKDLPSKNVISCQRRRVSCLSVSSGLVLQSNFCICHLSQHVHMGSTETLEGTSFSYLDTLLLNQSANQSNQWVHTDNMWFLPAK